jgi:hypothetical protein
MLRRPSAVLPAVLLGLLLAACGRGEPPPDPAERAEQRAAASLQQVEAARAAGRLDAARIYAEEILERYPETAAGQRMQGEITALREAAEAEREARRLAEMWTYHQVDYEDASAFTAYIFGQPETDQAPAVRLVLRRHPEWGQNAYLLIADGADFACRDECRAQLVIDDAEPRPFVISRAHDVAHPALFLEDDAGMLAAVESARLLQLELEIAGHGATVYRFETGGFDSARLGEPVAGS